MLLIMPVNISIRGPDVLNRTPVLDIKPYIPNPDSYSEVRSTVTDLPSNTSSSLTSTAWDIPPVVIV